MRDDNFYGSGVRSQKRKRKKADKILNISIGVVVFLILLVGGQLLLGGKSSEKVVSDQIKEQGELELEDLNEEASEDVSEEIEEAKPDQDPTEKEETKSTTDSSSTPTEQKPKDPSAASGQAASSPQMGQWKPIGTVQQEPFVAVFERDHVNWEEMRRAFQVATGLGEDLTLWYVRNGGNHESAVGVVADATTRSTPYQVRIEWVTNEGWMPVSVEQLETNPYDRSATQSTTDEDTDNN